MARDRANRLRVTRLIGALSMRRREKILREFSLSSIRSEREILRAYSLLKYSSVRERERESVIESEFHLQRGPRQFDLLLTEEVGEGRERESWPSWQKLEDFWYFRTELWRRSSDSKLKSECLA